LSQPRSTSAAPAAPNVVTVNIDDYYFDPPAITVIPGATEAAVVVALYREARHSFDCQELQLEVQERFAAQRAQRLSPELIERAGAQHEQHAGQAKSEGDGLPAEPGEAYDQLRAIMSDTDEPPVDAAATLGVIAGLAEGEQHADG
jgi:hypothetical protein